MGVPAFFRWLIPRYPKVLIDVANDKDSDGSDYSDEEFKDYQSSSVTYGKGIASFDKTNSEITNNHIPRIDNFYFDMNDIIHVAVANQYQTC